MSARRVALVAALVCLTAGAARAQRCPVPPGGSDALADLDAADRLTFLRQRLHASAQHAIAWMSTWAALNGGVMTVQLALLPSSNSEDKKDRIVGAAAGAIGVLSVTVIPPKALLLDRSLGRRLAAAPDACAQVALAEAAMASVERDEAFSRGPLMHAGSFAFNVGLGILIGAGFGHLESGSITALVGVGVGELMFFTRPQTTGRDLAQYRRGDLVSHHSRFNLAPLAGLTVVPLVSTAGPSGTTLGLGVAGAF